jgi:hypothetical protein
MQFIIQQHNTNLKALEKKVSVDILHTKATNLTLQSATGATAAVPALVSDCHSCQVDRNFSTLAHMLSHLRSKLAPGKVEVLMFLRCNRHLIPVLARPAALHELHAAMRAQTAHNIHCQQLSRLHSV